MQKWFTYEWPTAQRETHASRGTSPLSFPTSAQSQQWMGDLRKSAGPWVRRSFRKRRRRVMWQGGQCSCVGCVSIFPPPIDPPSFPPRTTISCLWWSRDRATCGPSALEASAPSSSTLPHEFRSRVALSLLKTRSHPLPSPAPRYIVGILLPLLEANPNPALNLNPKLSQRNVNNNETSQTSTFTCQHSPLLLPAFCPFHYYNFSHLSMIRFSHMRYNMLYHI